MLHGLLYRLMGNHMYTDGRVWKKQTEYGSRAEVKEIEKYKPAQKAVYNKKMPKQDAPA